MVVVDHTERPRWWDQIAMNYQSYLCCKEQEFHRVDILLPPEGDWLHMMYNACLYLLLVRWRGAIHCTPRAQTYSGRLMSMLTATGCPVKCRPVAVTVKLTTS